MRGMDDLGTQGLKAANRPFRQYEHGVGCTQCCEYAAAFKRVANEDVAPEGVVAVLVNGYGEAGVFKSETAQVGW